MNFRPVYLWVTDGPFFDSVLVINNPQRLESPIELTFFGCDGKSFNQIKLYSTLTQEIPLGPFLNGHKFEWGMRQGYLEVISELNVEVYFKPAGSSAPEIKSESLSNLSELRPDLEVCGWASVTHQMLRKHYFILVNPGLITQCVYVRLSIGELSVSRVIMINAKQLIPIDLSSEISILEKGCDKEKFDLEVRLSSTSLLEGDRLLYLLVLNHKTVPLV